MGDIRDLQFKCETSVLDPFVHFMLLLCLQNEPTALDSNVLLATKALLNILELRQSMFSCLQHCGSHPGPLHVLEACYHQEALGFVPYLSSFGVLRIEAQVSYILSTCSTALSLIYTPTPISHFKKDTLLVISFLSIF